MPDSTRLFGTVLYQFHLKPPQARGLQGKEVLASAQCTLMDVPGTSEQYLPFAVSCQVHYFCWCAQNLLRINLRNDLSYLSTVARRKAGKLTGLPQIQKH